LLFFFSRVDGLVQKRKKGKGKTEKTRQCNLKKNFKKKKEKGNSKNVHTNTTKTNKRVK